MHGSNIVYDAAANSLHIFSDAAAELLKSWSSGDKECDSDSVRGVISKYGLHANNGTASEIVSKYRLVAINEAANDVANKFGLATENEAVSAVVSKYGLTAVNEAASEIAGLVEVGKLFVPEEAEPDLSSLSQTYVFKSLCMHMAHDCNMRCAYCFASEGSFGHERGLMSYETARAAIDFITAASKGRTNIEIDFFGGEPLLNYSVIKRTVDYAVNLGLKKNKNFRFTLTTNGLLLDDEKIAYINENMDNLVLSADGRKSVNDKMRTFANSAGTYDHIIERFLQTVKKRDKSWYVRGTYTRHNKDFSEDVLHLADLGFTSLSVEPVVSPPNPELEFSDADFEELAVEYEKLAAAIHERNMSGNPVDFFHFNVDLEGGPCLARRIKGCGAGYEYAAVAPDGSLYPCHQFAGAKEFIIGNVFEGITNSAVVDQFKNNIIYAKPECMNCWAKYFCGGGCAANAWHYNRDIRKPAKFYCDLFRKRIECALWLKCAPYTNPANTQ